MTLVGCNPWIEFISQMSVGFILVLVINSASANDDDFVGLLRSTIARDWGSTLPKDCGKYGKSSAKIAGGSDAKPGEFPSFVQVVARYGSQIVARDIHCGGVILSEKLVLTAAHCLINPETGERAIKSVVRTGNKPVENFESPANIPVQNVCLAPNVVVHRKWNHDWAVLRLGKNLQFSENVQPACLLNREVRLNEIAQSVGMGMINENEVTSARLKKLQMTSVKCPKGVLKGSFICFRSPPTGMICPGDSGSAIYIVEKGRQFVVGITSHGPKFSCRPTSLVVMYTSIHGEQKGVKNKIKTC